MVHQSFCLLCFTLLLGCIVLSSSCDIMSTPEYWENLRKYRAEKRAKLLNETNANLEHTRTARYVLYETKWTKNALTYKIGPYSSKLNKIDVDTEIAKAFNVWSKYTDLTFTQKDVEPVDIEIKFVTARDDPANLFVRNVIVSYAYPPPIGDVYLSDHALWTIGKPQTKGSNLFQTVVHELGHALGLKHSEDSDAIMTSRNEYRPDFELQQDDINAIQALYGKKST